MIVMITTSTRSIACPIIVAMTISLIVAITPAIHLFVRMASVARLRVAITVRLLVQFLLLLLLLITVTITAKP